MEKNTLRIITTFKKGFTLGTTWFLGVNWIGSHLVEHLYETTMNQSGC